MKEKLTALFEVKKIIAITLTIVFCYLAIIGKIQSDNFQTIFIMIVTFYFGQSAVRQTIKENKEGYGNTYPLFFVHKCNLKYWCLYYIHYFRFYTYNT